MQNKANILGCNVDIVTLQDTIQKINDYIEEGTPKHIITLNGEIAYQASKERKLCEIINNVDLVTPDGIGIVWAAKQLGYPIKERVTGIDLVYALCAQAEKKDWKLYLLGAAPGVAEQASHKMKELYPEIQICGTQDGYFNESDISRVIKNVKHHRPDIIFIALGAPKQEYFINKYKDKMEVPICIGVGGSFDVISGNKKRAPELMIKLNIEWLYRLLSEPSRLTRQLDLPKFALAVLKDKYISKGNH
ncbi:WecB/TagA/CpsF family glycosyltransferase [Candidatus Syntrophocurvum alkaliphilum]|nr:WecB/TagA/CpsF family glycosyltransferase [Candidatus Syntrophocurvum alkaliphilum]